VQAQTHTGLDKPFYVSNRHPLVAIYGIPGAESGQLLAKGEGQLSLQAEAANSFTNSSNAVEQVYLDGESYRFNLSWRGGITETLELGVDVPYVYHRGGELDGFIEDWHDLWGLPDGNRDQYPRDQLRYAYARNGKPLLDYETRDEGVGDISAQLSWQISAQQRRQWALRLRGKMDSGDQDKLTGSGGKDISASLHLSQQQLFGNDALILHASAGLLWIEDSEVLESVVEDMAGFSSITMSWRVVPSFSLKVQLDAHTALYDSSTTELGDAAVQLVLGGGLSLGQRWQLDAWLTEDIAVDTGPDVVFGLGLTYRR
jgi:hypothetical protein